MATITNELCKEFATNVKLFPWAIRLSVSVRFFSRNLGCHPAPEIDILPFKIWVIYDKWRCCGTVAIDIELGSVIVLEVVG